MKTILTIAVMAGVAAAHAVVIEDFETDLSNYTNAGTGVPNVILQASSAHNGAMGANFAVNPGGSQFYYDGGILTAAGGTYRAYVRHASGLSPGRAYLGVNAGAGGMYSAVLGDNTNSVILQNNTTFGFVNMATMSFTPLRDTWYILELDWAANGDMTASVWDEAGTSLLAATAAIATGQTGSGGLGFRGFNGFEMDTVTCTVVPEPATMAALGLGALALVRRRRK
jgi:hypothetical protein